MTPSKTPTLEPHNSGDMVTAAPTLTPAPTRAAQVLDGRVLILTKSDALATAAHVAPDVSGLVLAGSKAHADAKTVRRQHPNLVIAIEPRSVSTYTATATKPFQLDEDGIIQETVEDVLESQRICGANITATPTGFIDIGDSRPAKEAVELANQIESDDTVLLMPVHYKWCQAEHIKQLIAIAKGSIHPVALILCDPQSDPLSHRGIPEGYRKFFTNVPNAIAWRADIGGFDALAYGALASVIGQLPSLRRGPDPGKQSFAINPADTTPNVFLPALLRYVRSSHMQENWFASVPSYTCDCNVCQGLPVDRFSGSSEDRFHGHLHNLSAITTMVREARLLGRDRLKGWWRGKLEAAEAAREQLIGYTSTKVESPPAIKQWLSLGL